MHFHTTTFTLFLVTLSLSFTLNASSNKACFYLINDSTQNISAKEYNLLLAQAKELTHLFKMDSAIYIYEKLYGCDTSKIEIVKELETLYTKTSQYRKALEYNNKILFDSPSNRHYQVKRGLLLKKLNENKEALQVFKTTLLTDSTNSYILNQIADIYRSMNKVDSALYYYSKVSNLKPLTQNLIKATDILHKHKMNKEALVFMQKYYDPEKHHSQLLNRLFGKIWYTNDSTYKAYSIFTDLYKQGDSSKVTTKYLGLCCWKNAYYPKGEEALRNYVSKDTTDYLAYYVLGICCKHTNKLKESQAFLSKSLELYLPDIKTLNMLHKGKAEVFEQQGRFNQAIAQYKIISKNDPNNFYADYKIATIYEFYIKDKSKALKCYQDLYNRIDKANPEGDYIIKDYCKMRIDAINKEMFWIQGKELKN
ncbi:hypothetical protein E9993_17515 [Labilibacter sediminis]|nr:hypothetical protein E9993_17515 [Labilibacter sediminis]